MTVLNYIILFTLFHSLIINAADSNCPKSFECGNLGTLEFPYSNLNGCGLFMVENCTSQFPSVQFAAGGPWYPILQKLSTNRLYILDEFLRDHLIMNFCLGVRNSSLPVSPSVSFSFSPSLTLFTCTNQSHSERIDEYFEHYNHTSCLVDVYYRDPSTNVSVADIPLECSVIHVPVISSSISSGNLSDWLAVEYVIEWSVSEECDECHGGGGKCLTNNENRFHCEKGKKRLVVVVSTACGGGVLLILGVSVFFIMWQRKRRIKEDYLLSRNRSFHPSSKPDVEGGSSYFGKDSTLPKLLGIREAKTRQEMDIELFLKHHGNLAPKRYKYSDLKKVTKSFKEKLGQGGYGSVYKGKLPDDRLVAVKILNESKGDGEEFMNEVASISRTSHINVVTLLGFCFEGSKRALVYELMPNGSLEKYLQNTAECGLGWGKLLDIALGIARGLDYLHQGCNTRILHFDIKPHNILLDKDFIPKISDFGLAKLCPNRSSIVSMLVARGTIGYIAPEVFCMNFGGVSYKSDVYSYGMMVLEIAGQKRKVERGEVDRTSETYFPQYIYKQLLEVDVERDVGGVDGIVNGDESELAKRKLIIVGLWCIQTDPKDSAVDE